MRDIRTLKTLACAAAAGGALALAPTALACEPAGKAEKPPAARAYFGAFASPFDDLVFAGAWPRLAEVEALNARISQRMTELARRMDELARAAPGGTLTAVSGPAGFCAQSVTITRAPGREPVVERRAWGDCARAPDAREETSARPAVARSPDLTLI